MYNIHFSFEERDLAPRLLTKIEDGETLLEIALKNGIAIQHQCGGVCSCTTCHLYVLEGMNHIRRMENREEDYLIKVGKAGSQSRLGCQALLVEGEGDIRVVVPDQGLFTRK